MGIPAFEKVLMIFTVQGLPCEQFDLFHRIRLLNSTDVPKE